MVVCPVIRSLCSCPVLLLGATVGCLVAVLLSLNALLNELTELSDRDVSHLWVLPICVGLISYQKCKHVLVCVKASLLIRYIVRLAWLLVHLSQAVSSLLEGVFESHQVQLCSQHSLWASCHARQWVLGLICLLGIRVERWWSSCRRRVVHYRLVPLCSESLSRERARLLTRKCRLVDVVVEMMLLLALIVIISVHLLR